MCTHKRGGSSGRLRRRKSLVVRPAEILGWKFPTDAELLLRLAAKGRFATRVNLVLVLKDRGSRRPLDSRCSARFGENRGSSRPREGFLNPLKDDNRGRHFRSETSPTSSAGTSPPSLPFFSSHSSVVDAINPHTLSQDDTRLPFLSLSLFRTVCLPAPAGLSRLRDFVPDNWQKSKADVFVFGPRARV